MQRSRHGAATGPGSRSPRPYSPNRRPIGPGAGWRAAPRLSAFSPGDETPLMVPFRFGYFGCAGQSRHGFACFGSPCFSTVILPLGSSVTARAAAMSSTPDWRSASFRSDWLTAWRSRTEWLGSPWRASSIGLPSISREKPGEHRDQPRQHPVQRHQQCCRGQRAPELCAAGQRPAQVRPDDDRHHDVERRPFAEYPPAGDPYQREPVDKDQRGAGAFLIPGQIGTAAEDRVHASSLSPRRPAASASRRAPRPCRFPFAGSSSAACAAR